MKNCKQCNSLLADDALFCSNCGCKAEECTTSTTTQTVTTPPAKTNVCSLLAVIFGAIGIIPLLNFLFLPAAIILAIIGLFLSKNRKKGITVASVIVVIISLVIFIAWISFVNSLTALLWKDLMDINEMIETSQDSVFDSLTEEGSETSQNSNIESSTEEQCEYLSVPDTVTTDYFKINIKSIHTNKEIRPSKTKGLYSYKKAETGKQYCYIKGTIKNTSSTAHQVSFLGDFIFDNKYTYSGTLLKEVDNGIDNIFMYETIQPLEEIEFYYACCIPNETINTYSSAKIEFEVISDLYNSSADTKYNEYSLSFSK